jgi:hypothetical protein
LDHIENDASNNFSIVACVYVAAVTFLPSLFLARIRGERHRLWEVFMKYAAEMGSSAMIYIPSFINIG